ncbi:MAG: hypothetical protein RIE06_05355 [Roseibium album]
MGLITNTEERLNFWLGVEPIGARLAQETPASDRLGSCPPVRYHDVFS